MIRAYEGMLTYRDNKVYRAVLSGDCHDCVFYSEKKKRCATPHCTRFRQWEKGEPLTFVFVDTFHPFYLSEIQFTSESQKEQIYEDHQREIEEYNNAIAGGVR